MSHFDPKDDAGTGNRPPRTTRLDDFLSEIVDGRLTATAAAELSALLQDNPSLQDEYIRFMSLHVQLTVRSDLVSSAIQAERSEEALPASAAAEVETARAEVIESPSRTPVLGFLGGVISYVSHSRALMLWLIGGGLSLYFIVQFGSLMISRFWAQNAPQLAQDGGAGTEKHVPSNEQSAQVESKIVARLSNSVDCRWEATDGSQASSDSSPPGAGVVELPLEAELHAGQKLSLAAGLAELTFESGAKVVLNAPSHFTVTDALAGNLQFGKLSAKVPHSAIGFTVASPGGKVIDRGTEFGVKVNYDRTMHVIVYVGEVEVKSNGSGAAPTVAGEQSVRVKAGEAISIGPDQPAKSISPADERIVRNITKLGDKSEADAAYVAIMKRLKPVVWFRMEGQDGDRTLHDEMGGAKECELHAGGSPFTPGRVGKCLNLRGGDKFGDYAVVKDYPKADKGRLSVVAWVYAESHPTYAGIAKNWSIRDIGQFEFTLMGMPGRDKDAYGDIGVFLADSNGKIVSLREGPKHMLPLFEWQHVGFTTDGKTARLYRQGREVASQAIDGLRYPVTPKALGIGVKLDDDKTPDTKFPDYWVGKIDELAIFNEALTADEIRQLATGSP